VVGMHFFNPVHRMRLLEVVRALETSEETVTTALAVGEQMGKECVWCASRRVRHEPHQRDDRQRGVLHAARRGRERHRHRQGAQTRAQPPDGPFELVDLVGLDTRLSILKFLHRTLGEKFRPCPLLEQYVAAGRLGRKSGRGVYEYET
jgi:3-hydroxybutyryl-CoA dehydrogenase